MSSLRYSAWCFVHPDFDTAEPHAGILNSATGGIEMVEEAASIRQSILLLLSTRTGERIMRPDYGTELHRLVFSPNDNTTAGFAIHYVRKALLRWEPRIEILHLDATRNPEVDSYLDMLLNYRVRSNQVTAQLTFSFNLAGEHI
jgi:phage baseplate assembly protein W